MNSSILQQIWLFHGTVFGFFGSCADFAVCLGIPAFSAWVPLGRLRWSRCAFGASRLMSCWFYIWTLIRYAGACSAWKPFKVRPTTDKKAEVAGLKRILYKVFISQILRSLLWPCLRLQIISCPYTEWFVLYPKMLDWFFFHTGFFFFFFFFPTRNF
jgi:hypothetical protein